MKTEYFPLVDDNGTVIGSASRKECHSGSFLLHPVVHLHVLNQSGGIYLQKRAANKDIQPGKWDTSVGGHVDLGEEVEAALRREALEELNIKDFEAHFIHRYKFISAVEAELVNSYYTVYEGEIIFDPVEIESGKFWQIQDILDHMGKEVFTPNFEDEFMNLYKLNLLPV